MVDPATVGAGLARYLGTVGPGYGLDYIAPEKITVAVVTVQPSLSGSRPYLARGTFSGTKPIIQAGRIYIRRAGATEEAADDEVDDMLTEMARERPALPAHVPPSVTSRVTAVFDPLLALAESEPGRAVEDAWQPLRQITMEMYESLLGYDPPSKVIDMVTDLARAGLVESGWVDVAYPLYYWPIKQDDRELQTTVGTVKSYLLLAAALATTLLAAAESPPPTPPS